MSIISQHSWKKERAGERPLDIDKNWPLRDPHEISNGSHTDDVYNQCNETRN